MCGRYSQSAPAEKIRQRFRLTDVPPGLKARYNIAPGQDAPVITHRTKRELKPMSWGLVPSWSKSESSGRIINARVETLLERPSFSGALMTRRCLVPADGFYEWRSDGRNRPKIPLRFERHDRGLFAFAGLWDVWRRADGSSLESYAIITTEADGVVRTVHSRMPVILDQSAEERWLDPGFRDVDALLDVLSPPSSTAALRLYRVSNMINSPQNDGPECAAEVEDETGDLFA